MTAFFRSLISSEFHHLFFAHAHNFQLHAMHTLKVQTKECKKDKREGLERVCKPLKRLRGSPHVWVACICSTAMFDNDDDMCVHLTHECRWLHNFCTFSFAFAFVSRSFEISPPSCMMWDDDVVRGLLLMINLIWNCCQKIILMRKRHF